MDIVLQQMALTGLSSDQLLVCSRIYITQLALPLEHGNEQLFRLRAMLLKQTVEEHGLLSETGEYVTQPTLQVEYGISFPEIFLIRDTLLGQTEQTGLSSVRKQPHPEYIQVHRKKCFVFLFYMFTPQLSRPNSACGSTPHTSTTHLPAPAHFHPSSGTKTDQGFHRRTPNTVQSVS